MKFFPWVMFFLNGAIAQKNPLSWDQKIQQLHQAQAQSIHEAKIKARQWVMDESLLVRALSVEVLSRNPSESDVQALWGALKDPRNWHKGKPLFVWYMILKKLHEIEPQKTQQWYEKWKQASSDFLE